MKRIIYICSLILVFTSCGDNLNIEPEQAISTNEALSDEDGILTAVIGTYDMLSQLPASVSGDVIVNSDLLGDIGDIVWTRFNIPLKELLDKNIAVTNNPVEHFWIFSYRTINQANTVLRAMEENNELYSVDYEAELRFIRGLVYFDLVNMYAMPWTAGNPESNLGVPIVSIPAEESLEDPSVPRNSVAEVYEFLLNDLQFAKANLKEENGVRASTYAASVLLSRVYLMQEIFQQASAEADRIISSGRYELLQDLDQVFNQSNNTPEDIFTIQVTSQDGFNRISQLYTGSIEGGSAYLGITDDHLNKYETGDLRANLFYRDQLSNTRRTGKWKVNSSRDGNVTTMRMAEMYLTRAEGRYYAGDIEGALDDVNTIRNRAGLSSITDLDLETILKERYLELVFEGHLFRDTKRNRKMFLDRSFDDSKLILPIPQRELVVNSSLVQNEGY